MVVHVLQFRCPTVISMARNSGFLMIVVAFGTSL